MEPRRITKRVVDSHGPGSLVWDSDVVGFGVRRQRVAKIYLLKTRIGGRQRWLTIGRHGSPWTPDTARREARRILGDVAGGDDPASARDANQQALSISPLCQKFLEQHADLKLRPRTVVVYRDILARFVIADFGQMRAQDLRRSDVARLHRDLANTPRQANHMLAVVSKLYNWAKIEGYVPSHSENPARDIEKYRESKRERYLSETELARLGKVLAESETEGTASPYAIAALRLLIFTGARLSEILTLRWSDIDLERRLLRLPEGKTGPRDVYLSAPALEVLSALPRLSNNPYVIVGGKAGSHIINLRKPWVRMRPRAGLDDVRIHDLRHSYASVDAVGGLPEGKSAKKLLLDLRAAGDKFFGPQIYERARRDGSKCQRRSKISPPGRSKTSPLNVMRYAVLGGCPGSP